MVAQVFSIQIPLLVMVIAGAVAGYRKLVEEKSLVFIVVDIFMPLLIVDLTRQSRIDLYDLGWVVVAMALISFFMIGVAFAFIRLTRSAVSEVLLPLVFPNTGFLGIPLLLLWGGTEAGNVAVVYDQSLSFIMIATGLVVCTGGFHMRALLRALRSPLLVATVVGFSIRFLDITLPKVILSTLEFGEGVAAPVAAFAVGVTLGQRRPEWSLRILGGLGVRFIAGASVALVVTWFLPLTREAATAIVILASLPSAVFSYVLPARYGVDSGFARSMVAISTVASVLVIPILVAFL